MKNFSESKSKIYFAVAVLLAVAAAFFLFSRPAKVDYIDAQAKDYARTLLCTGRVALEESAQIRAKVSGTLTEIKKSEGESISSGDVLAVLDSSERQLELAKAQSDLALARAGYENLISSDYPLAAKDYEKASLEYSAAYDSHERVKSLYEMGGISKQELDNSKSRLNILAAELEKARIRIGALSNGGSLRKEKLSQVQKSASDIEQLRRQIEDYTLVSPIAGTIIDAQAENGEFVQAGQLLFTVGNLQSNYVSIMIDEQDIGLLKVGQEAVISPKAYPEKRISGRLEYISPSVESATGTVEIRIKPLEDDEILIKDLTVDADIKIGEYKAAIALPGEYVILEEGRSYAFVYSGGRARKTEIQTLKDSSLGNVIVEKGISQGDKVLNPKGLRDSQRVSLGRQVD